MNPIRNEDTVHIIRLLGCDLHTTGPSVFFSGSPLPVSGLFLSYPSLNPWSQNKQSRLHSLYPEMSRWRALVGRRGAGNDLVNSRSFPQRFVLDTVYVQRAGEGREAPSTCGSCTTRGVLISFYRNLSARGSRLIKVRCVSGLPCGGSAPAHLMRAPCAAPFAPLVAHSDPCGQSCQRRAALLSAKDQADTSCQQQGSRQWRRMRKKRWAHGTILVIHSPFPRLVSPPVRHSKIRKSSCELGV